MKNVAKTPKVIQRSQHLDPSLLRRAHSKTTDVSRPSRFTEPVENRERNVVRKNRIRHDAVKQEKNYRKPLDVDSGVL